MGLRTPPEAGASPVRRACVHGARAYAFPLRGSALARVGCRRYPRDIGRGSQDFSRGAWIVSALETWKPPSLS